MKSVPVSADRPLKNPADDRLGYAGFAATLAKGLLERTPADGLVVALYGPWGSGKSTVLNFIEAGLSAAPEEERPLVMYFNPWWFSGQEDLTRAFFDQLQVLFKGKKLGKKARELLANLADIVGELPLIGVGSQVAKASSKALRPSEQSVVALKAGIEKALVNWGGRIVVFVDDIDRLAAEEVRSVFKLIKGVCDFPGVTYLLSFDKQVVIDSIAQLQGGSGEAYLEKIVQVPFDLPMPDRAALRAMFADKINSVMKDVPQEHVDNVYFANIFGAGIDPFLRVPRDVVRLANAVSVSFPAVHGEVNPVDFLAIETLRIFVPSVYDTIRQNPDQFCGTSEAMALSEHRRKFHDGWFANVDPRHAPIVRNVLMQLFPALQAIWANHHFGGSDWPRLWRRKMRLCVPEFFPVYFRLSPPLGGVSRAELLSFCSSPDVATLRESFRSFCSTKDATNTSKARVVLERLDDFVDELSAATCGMMIEALVSEGDTFFKADPDRPVFFEIHNNVRLGLIIRRLAGRVELAKLVAILAEAMQSAGSLSVAVWTLDFLTNTKEHRGLLDPGPDLDRLRQLAVTRIVANQSTLQDEIELQLLLRRWSEWGSSAAVQAWHDGVLQDRGQLGKLLAAFVQRQAVQGMSDLLARINERLDPRWLEPFIDPAKAATAVRAIADARDAPDPHVRAAKQYLYEYEALKKGEAPERDA